MVTSSRRRGAKSGGAGSGRRRPGLYAVSEFLSWLEAGIDDPDRGPCALACVVVDDWKEIRDRYGYRGLEQVVAELRELIAGKDAPVAAMGPAAFAFDCGSAAIEDLGRWIEGLPRRVGRHRFAIGDEHVGLSVSAAASRPAEDADGALVEVMRAAEAIHASGGNRGRRVGEKPEPPEAAEAATLRRLMDALRQDSVRVVFQPLLPCNDEEISHYQILPRLKTVEGGLIPAAEFIPVAARAGVLHILDRWMVIRALRVIGEQKMRVHLLVSQSGAALENPETFEDLRGILKRAGRAAAGLVLDYRHTDILTHLDAARRLVEMIRAAGAEVCVSGLDERGQWQLVIDTLQGGSLRLAAGMATRVEGDWEELESITSLVDAAHALEMKVILPTIEDTQTVARVWRSGIDYMQGNVIQAPDEALGFER